jgi:FLVCR family MFS transporter 7
MCNDLKILIQNRNYILIFFIFSLVYSLYAGVGFVINPLLIPFGYNEVAISLIGMLVVFFGTIGAISTGIFLDRTHKYLFALKTICFAATITMLLAIYLFNTGTYWGAVLFCLFAGFSIVPIMPVSFSLATESTHPL